MKKIFIITLVLVSFKSSAQSNSIDSLGRIIKTMQDQIAELMKPDTLTFTPSQMTLTRTSIANQTVSINNYAAMNNSGTVAAKASTDVSTLTSQLNAALVRIAALEAKIKTGKIISTIQ